MNYSEAKRRLSWDCFDCHIGQQYADGIKCRVSGARRSLLNVDVNLKSELDAIKTYVKISTRFKPAIAYRKFFDITFDGCRVISDMTQGTLVSNMFNAVVKSSNQPRKCPIKQSLIYYRNISIEEALPVFVPSTDLMVQVDFFSKRNLYLNVSLRGTITEK
ncbi:uncharacterized protein LOC6502562 [Drosophila ananassae]|nr:uncharacterized protein LOC6502562 [Drosophila ananassae]